MKVRNHPRLLQACVLSLFAGMHFSALANPSCTSDNTITLDNDSKTTIDGRSSNWQPGDTICIKSHPSGSNHSLRIQNLFGSAENPITIINTGGQVAFNFSGYTDMAVIVHNSRHLRITGSGSEHHFYGFKIDGSLGQTRKGVGFYKRSSDIELDHFEVGHVTSSGMGLTTFSNCSDGSVPARYRINGENGPYYDGDTGPYYDAYGRELVLVDDPNDYRQNFMHDYNNDGVVDALDASSKDDMRFSNAVYHDNYIHHTGTEGMYIGSNAGFRLYKKTTDPDPHAYPGSAMGGNERRICQYYSDSTLQNKIADGSYNEPISGQLAGVKIYNTLMDNIGWDAINVKSSAVDCQIFDNKISNFATANYNRDQINGIDVQINTHCDIYRNEIRDGNGVGIHSPGLGGVIANNLIVNVGNGYCDCDGDGNMDRSAGRESGMLIGMNTEQDHHFMVDENDTELLWSDIYAGHQYYLLNNTIINPVEEAIEFKLQIMNHTIANNLVDGVIDYNANVTVNENNLTAQNSMFEDAAAGNYRLSPTATTVINSGSNIAAYGLNTELSGFDLTKTIRPLQGAYDIGAYEYASLRVTVNGGGTVTSNPAGIDCGSICAFTFADTTTVTLTAVAGNNSHFVAWSGCDSENGNQCTVSGHKQVSATFAADNYTITAVAGTNGSISPSAEVVVANGGEQTFYFTADPFYQVEKVLVDGVDVGALASYTFTDVGANHSIEVSFISDPSQANLVELYLDETEGMVAHNSGTLTNNDGIVNGTVQWTSEGYNNGAMVFDGDDHINLGQPDELDFNPVNHSFTLSVRFKTTQYGALISKVSNAKELVQFYLFVNSNSYLYARAGSSSSIRTSFAVNDGQWHTATLVNDGVKQKFYLYVDGNYIGTKYSGDMSANGMDILVGARRNGSNSSTGFPYSGTMDEVKIFNRALSAQEILDNQL